MNDILEKICFHLTGKGFAHGEIVRLTREISYIIEQGGYFTVEAIDRRLTGAGWKEGAIDGCTFELILNYLEAEGSYTVERYTLH